MKNAILSLGREVVGSMAFDGLKSNLPRRGEGNLVMSTPILADVVELVQSSSERRREQELRLLLIEKTFEQQIESDKCETSVRIAKIQRSSEALKCLSSLELSEDQKVEVIKGLFSMIED